MCSFNDDTVVGDDEYTNAKAEEALQQARHLTHHIREQEDGTQVSSAFAESIDLVADRFRDSLLSGKLDGDQGEALTELFELGVEAVTTKDHAGALVWAALDEITANILDLDPASVVVAARYPALADQAARARAEAEFQRELAALLN